MTNRLAEADSAYLRQHATNPVDWFPWGDEPFALARQRDCPVFLSVGYAACHWCHVMAHESFADPTVAAVLNGGFVSIKVDREERPDVDAVYMTATQLFTGGGGWPMSVFLTPDRDPFVAGTYFPPVAAHGQPAFKDLLASVLDAWRTRRTEVVAQAAHLRTAVREESDFTDRLAPVTPAASWRALTDQLCRQLRARTDPAGGFGPPPKFPRPSYVDALLCRWSDPADAAAATTTLDAMARGGLYDHIGGGFARYSVDAAWHVPHFEKMLSDQALLARTYLRAHRTRGSGEWRDVALGALRFVARELAVPGGFASSLDADSAGIEGAHVTWTPTEVAAALGARGLGGLVDAALERWRITEPGLFEGRSIPRLAPGAPFVPDPPLDEVAAALLAARANRPAPGRDDKVVLEWNAMFACAAFESDDEPLVAIARDLLRSLHLTHHDEHVWWRTSARGARATAADVGWLIEAHLAAYEQSGDDAWLDGVAGVVAHLLDQYWDGPVPTAADPHAGRGVRTPARGVAGLPATPKEIYDGASPSPHAVVATACARFGAITGDENALAVAERIIELAGGLLTESPLAVPDLLGAYGVLDERREVVIPGPPGDLRALVRSRFVPAAVLVTGSGRSPLLAGRAPGLAYVCHRGACAVPADGTATLDAQLDDLGWAG